MKINFVSFSDYSSEIEIYDLKKMDLFVFLLVDIIKKGSDKTIEEVLLDLDVSKALLYLYQDNFYYLLDNKLIVNSSDSEDISEIVVNDIKFSEFGKYCLDNKSICEFSERVSRRVIYNPFEERLVSDNKISNTSNVVVYSKDINYLELLNKYKKEILSRYDNDFVLNYRKNEANPFYYEVNVSENNLDKYKEYLKENGVCFEDDKVIEEKRKEFMSSNFKIKLFYGSEKNLVNSDYYVIVSDSKKFTVSENKVYVESIIDELSEYSFVSVDKECMGYNLSRIKIDEESYSVFESKKINDCSKEIKKYLMRNKDKYKDTRVIEKIIDLL